MVSSQTQISVTAGKSHKHFATLQRDDIPVDQACGGGDGPLPGELTACAATFHLHLLLWGHAVSYP